MVESKPISTGTASQMTPTEMCGLAKRLRARAESVLMKDQPAQQADLRQAADLVERLAAISAEILASAAVIDGLARLLQITGGA
jgi:hypothetical protein